MSGKSDNTEWLGSLIFDRFLGSGSFGVVLKAVDKISDAPSAVKIIFLNSPKDKCSIEKAKRISREFDNLVNKEHVNIVRTFKLAERTYTHMDIQGLFKGIKLDDNAKGRKYKYWRKAKKRGGVMAICIQMELCGHTLRQWLNENRDTDIDSLGHCQCSIVQGLIEGLKFLHSNKIIHRDFKPDNIYFSTGYSLPIKIGDFGLSRELDDTSLTAGVGTSAYRAPEANSNVYTTQADLYSLGLVMWEVLQLIKKEDREDLFQKLIHENAESLIMHHTLVTNCREIIFKLTKPTCDRYMSIDEINLRLKVVYKPRNSEEFRTCLLQVQEGDEIDLLGVEYEGPFFLDINRVVIRGVGEDTVIISRVLFSTDLLLLLVHKRSKIGIRITGDNCKVADVKVISDDTSWWKMLLPLPSYLYLHATRSYGIDIVGSNNSVENACFEGNDSSLEAVGNFNNFSNLSVSNAEHGLWIEGDCNKLDKIRVNDVMKHGIYIDGKFNQLVSVSCRNAKYFNGIVIMGNQNRIVDTDGGTLIDISGSGHMLVSSKAQFCIIRDNGTDITYEGCGLHDRGLILRLN